MLSHVFIRNILLLLAKPFPMHITRHLGFGLAVHQALVIINSLDMYTLERGFGLAVHQALVIINSLDMYTQGTTVV